MAYNPTLIPSQGFAPGINAISGAVQEWQQKQEEQNRQMGFNDSVVQHAAQNGLISPEELTKYHAASLTQKTGIAAGIAANLHDDLLRQNAKAEQDYHTAALANAMDIAKLQADTQTSIAAARVPNSPYAQTAIWADDGAGKQIQIGNYDERGTPHYFPYGHVGGGPGAVPFVPTDETTKVMGDAGYTFAQTSNKGGRWINTKGGKDLDENGNPIMSPDGTTFMSGGRPHAVTQSMIQGKQIHDAEVQAAAEAKAKAAADAQPGWWQRNFGGGGATPTPSPLVTPTPTPAPAPVAAGAPAVDSAVALAQARAKINAGGDPAAVKARLIKLGVDPSGL